MTDTTALSEIRVLTRIVKALNELDTGAQVRTVAWLWEKYMGVPHAAVEVPTDAR